MSSHQHVCDETDGRDLTDLYRSTNSSYGTRKKRNRLNSSLRRKRKMKKTIHSIRRLASAEVVSHEDFYQRSGEGERS